MLAIPRPGGPYYAVRRYPAAVRAGRIGPRRVGAEVSALAADGTAGELRELTKYPFPTGPVTGVGLFADPGGAAVEMAARFHDLRVLSGPGLPPRPPAAGLTEYEVNPLPPDLDGESPAGPTPADGGVPGKPPAPVRGGYVWVAVAALVVGLVGGAVIARTTFRRSAQAGHAK